MASESMFRVRYAETDQMGVAYHANFFVWFEVGRVDFFRQFGLTYRDMERKDDCYIAVVDARCRYKSPARYDDEITVRTYLKNVRDSLIHFRYEIVRSADDALLAEGETTHLVTDASMQITPLPERYRLIFENALGKSAAK